MLMLTKMLKHLAIYIYYVRYNASSILYIRIHIYIYIIYYDLESMIFVLYLCK